MTRNRKSGYGKGSPAQNWSPAAFKSPGRQFTGNILNFNYEIGQIIYQELTNQWIIYRGNGIWDVFAGGSSTDLLSLSGDDGLIIDPNDDGDINIEGQVVANATNVKSLYFKNTADNTLTGQIQLAAAIAATDVTKTGLLAPSSAHFTVDANGFLDSKASTAQASSSFANAGISSFNQDQFNVDANGFVELQGGGTAVDSINVDANTPPGTDPVLPDGNGQITITGGQVAAGTTVNAIQTNSLAANTYSIQIQRASVQASATVGANGVSHFNSATSSIDANGFMSPFQYAKWVVNPIVGLGTHTTITTALAAAAAGDYILVTQGTYTENFTLPSGITLSGMPCAGDNPAVRIVGQITMTAAGSSTIANMQLETNSNFFITISGSNACILTIDTCNLLCVNNSGINFTNSNTSSEINLYNTFGDIQTTGISFFSMTGNTLLFFNNTFISNSGESTTQSTNTSGSVQIRISQLNIPISCTGTSAFLSTASQFNQNSGSVANINIAGSGANNINNCRIVHAGGSVAPITMSSSLSIYNSNVATNFTNWITGSGTLNYAGISTLGATIGGGISATGSNFYAGNVL